MGFERLVYHTQAALGRTRGPSRDKEVIHIHKDEA